MRGSRRYLLIHCLQHSNSVIIITLSPYRIYHPCQTTGDSLITTPLDLHRAAFVIGCYKPKGRF